MAPDNKEFDIDDNASEGKMPLDEASINDKLKDYGKKSLSPLVDLLHQYKDDLHPYVNALSKGLEAAASSFQQNGESTEADRVVGGWYREAHEWFEGAREKLRSKNSSDLLRFLEDEAKARPGVMFASSYVVGLVFGRLGRHLVRVKTNPEASQMH